MNKTLYAIHKWISAIAFVQLTVWTVTGTLFVVLPQDALKSAPVENAHRGTLDAAPAVPVARALEVAGAEAGAVERVELRATPTGPFYLVKGDKGTVRVDARTGALAPVTQVEAEAVARRDQPASPAVRETTLVKGKPAIEYRDGALPAYRVALADAAGTVIYVDASTGDVTQRRNDAWRTYDLIWALHIMDYRGREHFNHPLIFIAVALALGTVLSGIVLLAIRGARWVRRRAAA
jgi:predicted secreted protein